LTLLQASSYFETMRYALDNMPVRPENINEPVTYNQGRAINVAVGGIHVLCGGESTLEAASAAQMSAADILSRMGLNRGRASEVLEAMTKAGVYGENFARKEDTAAVRAQKEQKASIAARILFSVEGVHCLARAGVALPPPLSEAEQKAKREARKARFANKSEQGAISATAHLITGSLLEQYRAVSAQWYSDPVLMAAFQRGEAPPR
jgi:hypothetical protein